MELLKQINLKKHMKTLLILNFEKFSEKGFRVARRIQSEICWNTTPHKISSSQTSGEATFIPVLYELLALNQSICQGYLYIL